VYHNPVLLSECIEGLAIQKDGLYVDVTFGGGGHAQAVLGKLGKKGRLLAFDRDADAAQNCIADERFSLIRHNYRFLKRYLRYHDAIPVDGILADLGISSHQIDQPERGFSTRFDGPLDLRMDPKRGKSAARLVNELSREELTYVFRVYGELDHPERIADSIIRARQEKEIVSTVDLKQAVRTLTHPGKEQKFYARIFQALRIEVNKELEALQEMLKQSLDVLRPGGRLVVISYHSLEDRLVKNFIRTGNFEGLEEKDPIYGHVSSPFNAVSRKAVVAGTEEVDRNPRARSAKLRIAEKK
jgi:16S rRNA (cytosine1402-N4)-methyltransferase